MSLLNSATLEYAQPRRAAPLKDLTAKPPKEDSAAVKHLTYKDAVDDDDVELEYREGGKHAPIPQLDITVDAPPTFWWEK